jgi:hypothetical protein
MMASELISISWTTGRLIFTVAIRRIIPVSILTSSIESAISAKGDGVTSCISDYEALAWYREKKQILPFQILSTRKRKDANEAEIKVQVEFPK